MLWRSSSPPFHLPWIWYTVNSSIPTEFSTWSHFLISCFHMVVFILNQSFAFICFVFECLIITIAIACLRLLVRFTCLNSRFLLRVKSRVGSRLSKGTCRQGKLSWQVVFGRSNELSTNMRDGNIVSIFLYLLVLLFQRWLCIVRSNILQSLHNFAVFWIYLLKVSPSLCNIQAF